MRRLLLFAHVTGSVHSGRLPPYESSFSAAMKLPRVKFCEKEEEQGSVAFWRVCRVWDGNCTMVEAVQSGRPTMILWQTIVSEQEQPNELQQFNARYLPNGAEIRWVNDAGMASMIRDISVDMRNAGAADNLCKAFAMMRPGAYRADIWRAAVLWKYGGMYLDNKIILTKPIHSWIVPSNKSSDVAILTKDRVLPCFVFDGWLPAPILASLVSIETNCPFDGISRGVWNAVAYASKPHLSVFSCMLEHIISNIAKQTYRHSLHITGPVAWRVGARHHELGQCGSPHAVAFDAVERKLHRGRVFDREYDGLVVLEDGTDVMASDIAYHDSSKVSGIKYQFYFHTGQVYCTERYQFPTQSWSYWYSWIRYCRICLVFDGICAHHAGFNHHCNVYEGHASAYRKSDVQTPEDPCVEKLYDASRLGWPSLIDILCLISVFTLSAATSHFWLVPFFASHIAQRSVFSSVTVFTVGLAVCLYFGYKRWFRNRDMRQKKPDGLDDCKEVIVENETEQTSLKRGSFSKTWSLFRRKQGDS